MAIFTVRKSRSGGFLETPKSLDQRAAVGAEKDSGIPRSFWYAATPRRVSRSRNNQVVLRISTGLSELSDPAGKAFDGPLR
jgi:hypothetical protein